MFFSVFDTVMEKNHSNIEKKKENIKDIPRPGLRNLREMLFPVLIFKISHSQQSLEEKKNRLYFPIGEFPLLL